MIFEHQRGRVAFFLAGVARAFVNPLADAAARIGAGFVEAQPLRRSSSQALLAASLFAVALCVADDAYAAVNCTGLPPFTCTGTQSTTFTITPALSPVTFDGGTNITNAAGLAIDATGTAVTNQGTFIGGSGNESFLMNGFGMLTNFGTIGATTGALRGIQFNNGGTIINQAGGQILGSLRGIDGN